ncbi:hypothetical protein FRB93_012817 [Tulasnella sp. JGI-2019a]|nr:hypothetical protein FRB93_012817 [Tulasnella sp. JGI-2019a]
MTIETIDVVVVGAGWYGLAAAKSYVQVDPDVNLVVLDAYPTLGGVWAEHLLYPGLRTNNLFGALEYPDFPMHGLGLPAKEGEHLTGEVIHAYLQLYADTFDVTRRIRFNTKVATIERIDDMFWQVTTESDSVINCNKVIIATGITSQPFIPFIPGFESLACPIFHTRDLSEKSSEVMKTAETVAVLGGNKSAWDTAYMFATAGIKVNFIIRSSGHGPGWMAPIRVTPLKIWLEKLVTTRFLTWFSPCIWGDADGYGSIRGWLHGTRLGRWFVDRFWDVLTNDLLTLNAYDAHPKTKVLKPWFSSFWSGTSLSILNYPTNFFDLVKSDAIKIHIADINHISAKTIHLSTGTTLETDALIFCTGWKYIPAIKFLPEGIEKDLGLPYTSTESDPLVDAADKDILSQFPRLARQPVINPNLRVMRGEGRVPVTPEDAKVNIHPFQLYRFIAPPTNRFDNSITFNGLMQCINTAMNAELQGLWSVAYLTGKLGEKAPAGGQSSEEERMWISVRDSRFGRWRYPGGNGSNYPDFVFDALPYFDTLLQDLGVASRRKSSLLADIFTPYSAPDYKGVLDEWLGRVGSEKPANRMY